MKAVELKVGMMLSRVGTIKVCPKPARVKNIRRREDGALVISIRDGLCYILSEDSQVEVVL